MRARWYRPKHWIALCVPLAVSGVLTSCGLADELPPVATPTIKPGANLFVNPGFEDAREPWRVLDQPGWQPFEVSDTVSYSGSHSASLSLADRDSAIGTSITGAIQEVRPAAFPEFLSGYYRVDEWEPNATFQYLQFVAVVNGGDFGDDLATHQIRFPLAGIDRAPFTLSNAQFLFLSRDAPDLGEWIYFGYPIGHAFQQKWGRVPAGFESIEFFFEVRYDGKTAEQPVSTAQVYFDDLYVGPQLDNPNRPLED